MNNNLKEKVTHGDFYLPFSTYEGVDKGLTCYIPIHWHEELEIAYISKGITEINIDLNNYVAKTGDICFIKPLSLHAFKNPNIDHTICWHSMVFNSSMIQSALTDGCLIKYIAPLLNNENELPLILNNTSPGYNEILETILNLFNCYKDKYDGYELEIKSLLFHLFSLLYKYNLVKKSPKKNISCDATYKIKNTLNYISENYYNPITINELAEICGFSEYHFMKFFKKHTGMTCIEYINNYRLEEASKLLTHSNKSIMDISFEVGFNSVSYFNKLFKKTYNLTPKDFRNKAN